MIFMITISITDIAELVLDLKYVKFEKFLVNSGNFKIELNYELVDSDEEW